PDRQREVDHEKRDRRSHDGSVLGRAARAGAGARTADWPGGPAHDAHDADDGADADRDEGHARADDADGADARADARHDAGASRRHAEDVSGYGGSRRDQEGRLTEIPRLTRTP